MGRLFEATPTGVACVRALDALAAEGLLGEPERSRLRAYLSRALYGTPARIGAPSCVLQARVRTLRCYRSVWAYLLEGVRVCTVEGRPVAAPPGAFRLVVQAGGTAEEPLPDVAPHRYGETVRLLLGRELAGSLAPGVAKRALLTGKGAPPRATPAAALLLGSAAAPQSGEDSDEDDEEIREAVGRTAVAAWGLGTFEAPPRKVSSKSADKRVCTLARAVLYDGERELAFRHLQLELLMA